MKEYTTYTKELNQSLGQFRKEQPEVMSGFSTLAQAALKDGALDKKTKELLALAIGVTQRCDGCIGFHTQALVRLGATREEVMETLSMCVYMGGGPALMYVGHAVKAFDEASKGA